MVNKAEWLKQIERKILDPHELASWVKKVGPLSWLAGISLATKSTIQTSWMGSGSFGCRC
jgi:hypothetical protein